MTGAPLPGLIHIYHGHEGVRAFWRDWLDAWEGIEWNQGEPEELPDGRVAIRIHNQRNTGRESGIAIPQRDYEQLWTIENGKVSRMEMHWLD